MRPSTNTVSRFAESALVDGAFAKKGTASNGVTAIAATTDKPAGLVQNAVSAGQVAAPDVSDRSVSLVVSGHGWAIAGAAIEIDDDLQVTAAGLVTPKSGAGYVVGKALTKAAINEAVEIFVNIRKEPA